MYIIFKVCLEYYLYIKYNKKKLVLFTSTSSFKEYVKTTWSKKNATNDKTSSLVFNRKP